jgi:hypothetical protein
VLFESKNVPILNQLIKNSPSRGNLFKKAI